jgi:hypothetical protein
MSTPPPEGKKPLSTGAIVAIVIVALVIIGAGVCFAVVFTA